MPRTHRVTFGAGASVQSYAAQYDEGAGAADSLSRTTTPARAFTDSGGLSDAGTRVNRTASETDPVSASDTLGTSLIRPSNFPKVASIHTNSGESYAQAVNRYFGYGYNGFVRYVNGSTQVSWDATMQAIAATWGNDPINVQYTFKLYNSTAMRQFIPNIPPAWRPYWIFNHYQEPEANFVGDPTAQANWRNTYPLIAADIAATGNTIQLPWLELTEYSLLLKYVNGDLSRDPDLYVPTSSSYAGVLWSLFEYSENYNPTGRLQPQIDRITRCMDETYTGKPWGLMASAYTLEPVSLSPNYTTAQFTNQKNWLLECYNRTKADGSHSWGWFDALWNSGTNADGESRININPQTANLLATLN
jgi:hypothetical protein